MPTRNNSLSNVQESLNNALRNPGDVVGMQPEELDLLLQLLRRVRLHGTVAARLHQMGVFEELPQILKDQLESALVMADARERVARWELNRIEWATRDQENMQLVCMKGCAYFMLGLPSARGRIFADVDLLVPEAQLRRVEHLLNRRGWRTQELTPYDDNYYRRWTHELPPLVHVERDVEIDLHHNILPRTARLKPDGAKLIADTIQLSGSPFHVLADIDLVLHAMTHLMFNDEMADKLRDLVDIDGMLRHFADADDQFWPRLVTRAGELDLRRAAFYGLRYARNLLDSPVPDSVMLQIGGWGPGGSAEWLMDRLVPRALYPQHPVHASRLTSMARWLLYVRSHWIRMPPWLLVYHLGYKAWVKRFGVSRALHNGADEA